MVFGLCSFLIPAGYNNDSYLYQLPHQSLLTSRKGSLKEGNYSVQQPPATIGEADEVEDELQNGGMLVGTEVLAKLICSQAVIIASSL